MDGWASKLRQTRAFLGNWQHFLAQKRDETGATAFRMHLGGPVVAVIDGIGIRAMRDPERFGRTYGFGPRKPSPAVIGRGVPTIFTDGELHQRRKQAHLQLYREASGELPEIVDGVLDQALPRWERGEVTALQPELERMVGQVLFRWLLDTDAPLADLRAVGNGVIPFRPVQGVPLPGDSRVRRAFHRLVAFVLASPRASRLVQVAERQGLPPEELARDLAFVLSMNAWAALSGALVSALAELSRHPEHRHRIADDPSAADDVVREVLRLHPPAPVVFGVAREEGTLPTTRGEVPLRKGEVLMGVLAMAHRDPETFADPDTFLPARFEDRALTDEVLWTGGPEGLQPTPHDRVCAGRGAVLAVLQRMVVRICQGRWALLRRPEWGHKLTPRNVPEQPLVLVAYRRGPAGLAWTGPGGSLSRGDSLRMKLVAAVRSVQQRSVEVWSETTYRTAPRPSAAPEVTPSARVLDAPDVPPFLLSPRQVPRHGTMGLRYVVPYYVFAGVLFGYLERAGLDPATPFRVGHPALQRFPDGPEGWGNLQQDETFGRMRLQGPNPYLLRADGGSFVVDYARSMEGIAPPVLCRFEVDGTELRPTSIQIDGQEHRPGSPGWRRAKLFANAVEARMTVFGEHLGRTHLVISQAFALARFQVPAEHPLRPLLDLHAFATLQVNDFAYKLLVSPSSYFVRSGFISRDQVFRIFRNLWPVTDAVRLLPAQDIERRGLHQIPEHPYVTEALPAFQALRTYTSAVVDSYYSDDGSVSADEALAAWDRALRSALPAPAAELLPSPRTRAGLAELLAAWVYNNVAHEVCGDFSPYVSGSDEEQAQLIDFDRLRMGMENGPPSLASVFLMKQGAYAGLFDTRGNSMVGVNPRRVTSCPAHQGALGALQTTLRSMSEGVRARNAQRKIPFGRMDPAKWELSIGF
jgi:cytochrome P450